MVVTPFGTVMLLSPLQFENADDSILSKFSGKTMFFKPVQFENAHESIPVKLVDNDMLFRLVHPQKA